MAVVLGCGGARQGGGFRLDHGQRVGALAGSAFVAVAILGTGGPVVAAVAAIAVATFAAVGAAITTVGAAITAAGAAVTAVGASVVASAFVAVTILPGLRRPRIGTRLGSRLRPRFGGTVFAALAVVAILAVFIAPVFRTPLAAVFAAIFLPPVLAALLRTIVAALVLTVLAAFVAGLGLGGLALRRLAAALVLEVDVDARGEGVAPDDLGGWTLRLHRPQQAEIVFGVLQIVLGQHPVARRGGVARELLVLFEHVLGVPANLHAVGPVGIEGPIGVVLRLSAAATATAAATAATAAITAALPFHALEISHMGR